MNTALQSLQPYVVKSLFCESGTYRPMMLRTYETRFSDGVLGKIDAITEGGRLLGRNSLSSVASDIITPSTAPTATLSIDEGWGTRRFTFVIELACPGMTGDTQSVVLTGYTNYTDVSPLTKSFDPNMRLYFNNSSIVSTITTRLPNGQIHNRRILRDSSHVLCSSVISAINPQTPMYHNYQSPIQDGTVWMLPKHIINEMVNMSYNESSWDAGTWTDFRRRANPHAVTRSKRDHAVPGSYLDRIITNVTNELNKSQSLDAGDEIRSLSDAAFAAADLGAHADPVLFAIQSKTEFLRTGYITWGEFVSIFPRADDRTVFTTRATAQLNTGTPTASSEDVEGWNGLTYETTIANSVSQLVPAIMTNCLIGNISFMFTNDNPAMEPTLTILNGNSLIDGVDISILSNNFISRFINEVYPVISNQQTSIVSLMVHSNIGTETHISVSYNNGPSVPYCAPTFCDAMYTPIISPTDATVSNIASDLYSIAAMASNNHMTGYTGGLVNGY